MTLVFLDGHGFFLVDFMLYGTINVLAYGEKASQSDSKQKTTPHIGRHIELGFFITMQALTAET